MSPQRPRVVLFRNNEGKLLGWVTPTRHWATQYPTISEKKSLLTLLGKVRELIQPFVDNGQEVITIVCPTTWEPELERFKNIVRNIS